MSKSPSSGSKSSVLKVVGAVVFLATVVVMIVLPAGTGYDPTGFGKLAGLVENLEPVNAELERGLARMEKQEVLLLSDTEPAQESGAVDSWQYELGPFESVEFKYIIPEGSRMAFRWEGTAPLKYDMHSHPFEGGVEATESFGIDEAQVMQGVYISPFTGIHGWYWQNRSLENVFLRVETSGGMTSSTIFSSNGEIERPIEGVINAVKGEAAGHAMQDAE